MKTKEFLKQYKICCRSAITIAAYVLFLAAGTVAAQGDPLPRRYDDILSENSPQDDQDLTLSGYLDGGYRQTQFFEEHHDAAVLLWDFRAEFWMPPSRKVFSWGPYLRLAGIMASRDQPWENSWQAVPGVGVQIYPLSFKRRNNSENDTVLGQIFGPLRIFGEYNLQHYWGEENSWRPEEQIKVGVDYWRAINVNNCDAMWWLDTWHGFWWQSADENSDDYHAWRLANSVRAGVRVPRSGWLSTITPYVAVESALSDRSTHFWENRLAMGGGIRISPPLNASENVLNYAAVYAEYVRTVTYYRGVADSSVPDHEIRVGITVGFGNWFKR